MTRPAGSLRRMLQVLGPSWLTKDVITLPDKTEVEVDERALFAVALTRDALLERTRLGVRARFPGIEDARGQLAPPDAFPHLAADRLIIPGQTEPLEALAARLRRAIDDHRRRGTAWAMLEQLRAYCTPHEVMVRLVNNHGNFYTITRDGQRQRVKHTGWNWDSAPYTQWSRFWVMIYPTMGSPRLPWDRGTPWGGGGQWGDAGRTWGSTATHADVSAIRSIVDTWKHDGSKCMGIMLVWNDNIFDPIDFLPTLPDGDWGTYGHYVGGVKTRSRSAVVTYWAGT